MEFLRLKRRSTTNAQGARIVEAIWRKKSRKYGRIERDTYIPRGRPLLVVGPHDSGKSRILTRLGSDWEGVYGATCRAVLRLPALAPLSAWTAAPDLAEWYAARPGNGVEWRRVPGWQKSELLADFAADRRALVVLDDAHRLSGRKLQLARLCCLAAPLWIVSAIDEGQIAPSLRAVLLRRDPFVLRLSSDVAYDLTRPLVWALLLLLMVAGAHEAALIGGGLMALSGGRRAAKQVG